MQKNYNLQRNVKSSPISSRNCQRYEKKKVQFVKYLQIKVVELDLFVK